MSFHKKIIIKVTRTNYEMNKKKENLQLPTIKKDTKMEIMRKCFLLRQTERIAFFQSMHIFTTLSS